MVNVMGGAFEECRRQDPRFKGESPHGEGQSFPRLGRQMTTAFPSRSVLGSNLFCRQRLFRVATYRPPKPIGLLKLLPDLFLSHLLLRQQRKLLVGRLFLVKRFD